MIPLGDFDHMLELAKQAGEAGRPMPNLGYLRDATPDQVRAINDAYSCARLTRTARRGGLS